MAAAVLLGCERAPAPDAQGSLRDEASPRFRNVAAPTAYVGDSACVSCHEQPAAAYRSHAMAQSFHRWTPAVRIERPLAQALHHAPTGFYYTVVEDADGLYQEEFLVGPDGRRLHELRRRIDYVMGSGTVARTYFTAENGRLFQLPLTWYRDHGWDFSPGYEVNNARFDRLMPDRCIACHSSYPEPIPFVEGKYAELRPGIGCERCHGPGALHARERAAKAPADTLFDNSIVNPKHLPFERRLDVCEQCHVHTPVTVLREGRDAFDYLPSQPLAEHAAFFKATGSIDIVSHADRLRQSACFRATRASDRPLECATCHDFHAPATNVATHNAACQVCHTAAGLEARLESAASLATHVASDCVGCHMPRSRERTVPHGAFTDHWIRVVPPSQTPPEAGRGSDGPVEPYYERDRSGPDAQVYRAMGEVVFATLANDARLLDASAAALRRALERDTIRSDAQFVLGLAYRQLGRPEDAVPPLEQSLRHGRARPERLHALARAFQAAGHATDTVARLYERALAAQPALAWIRADYARFLHAHGRLDDAEAAYRAALHERPSLAVAAFNLGTLLTASGRLNEAAEAFRSAVRFDPSLAEAMAPLFLVRASGNAVAGVRTAGAPIEALPLRYRGPQWVRLAVARDGGAVVLANVPPGASVRIVEPDGTLVRALSSEQGSVLRWDLLDAAGRPIGGGLYWADVGVGEGAGRLRGSQRVAFGVVRLGG